MAYRQSRYSRPRARSSRGRRGRSTGRTPIWVRTSAQWDETWAELGAEHTFGTDLLPVGNVAPGTVTGSTLTRVRAHCVFAQTTVPRQSYWRVGILICDRNIPLAEYPNPALEPNDWDWLYWEEWSAWENFPVATSATGETAYAFHLDAKSQRRIEMPEASAHMFVSHYTPTATPQFYGRVVCSTLIRH